jgi:hypothetical protein
VDLHLVRRPQRADGRHRMEPGSRPITHAPRLSFTNSFD